MYFRSQKKTASDVSLSECIETGKDGTSLSLMDVIDSEEDLFEDLSAREMHGKLREIMQQVLTPREAGNSHASLRALQPAAAGPSVSLPRAAASAGAM